MAKKAFVIGANVGNLRYAASGAEGVASVLREVGYEVVPKFQSTNGISGESLLTILRKMTLNSGVDDTVIFYFSGHGKISSRDNKTLFFVLNSSDLINLEETAFSFRDVADSFTRCPATYKLVILDCCEATDEGVNFGNRGSYGLIRASENYGTAKEDDDLKSSFLTYYFCEAIREMVKREENLSFYSLMQFLHQKLVEYNKGKPVKDKAVVIQTGRISSDFNIITSSEVKVFRENSLYDIDNIRLQLEKLKKNKLLYSASFVAFELQQAILEIKNKGYFGNISIDDMFERIGLGNGFLFALKRYQKIFQLTALQQLACLLRDENLIKDCCDKHSRLADILKELKNHV